MDYKIFEINTDYDAEVCNIIKAVGEEYGAVGEGYGPSDAEVNAMSQYYTEQTKSCYLIATINNKVVGGCGIASLAGSASTCELKKLFLLPDSRGLGLGKKLSQACLDFAIKQGYQDCYLDTLSNMQSAIALYEKLGFRHLDAPIASSEHGACDVWMLKPLEDSLANT